MGTRVGVDWRKLIVTIAMFAVSILFLLPFIWML